PASRLHLSLFVTTVTIPKATPPMSTSVPVAGERCPRPPNSTREVQSSTNTPGGGEAARMPGKVTYEHLLKWRVLHAHSLNACEALTTFVHFSFSSPRLALHGVSCRGGCPQHPRQPQGLPVGLTKPLLSSGLHRLDEAQDVFQFAQAPFMTPEVGRQLIVLDVKAQPIVREVV